MTNSQRSLDLDARGATFSPCRLYRYRLWRRWANGPWINFVMLNPSTADELTNDPTVERCERRARSWGYGALVVTNIFGLRSTNPDALYGFTSPIGPDNDAQILEAADGASMVVCAWGVHGKLLDRGSEVLGLLNLAGIATYALKVSKGGHPCHPLYLPYDLTPKLLIPK